MTNSRWINAQSAEKNYWETQKRRINDEEKSRFYWEELLINGYGINYSFFKDKKVLEIGCGPAGVIFFIPNTKERVGLEPLNIYHLLDESKNQILKKGMGEDIPYPDNYFDNIICFNVLDHSVDPQIILNEIYRTLKNDGNFLLWIHVLKRKFKSLTFILNKFDSPHPYHFSYLEIINMIKKENFKIIYEKLFQGLGPCTKSKTIPHDTNLKLKIGELMMDDLWLILKK